MKILWVCNALPAIIAQKAGKEETVKEGWLSGTLQRILEEKQSECNIAVAYPVEKKEMEQDWSVSFENMQVQLYSFYEDLAQPYNYCESMEKRFGDILKKYEPDIVHGFGTEYPHACAMARCLKNTSKYIISLQGIISLCGEEYLADLTDDIVYRSTFRDLLKKDNIAQQQAKFLERGEYEKEAIRLTRHVIGRTDFDRQAALKINDKLQYHYMGETLRDVFYTDGWDIQTCEKHTIFISQGDYPLKGFHYLLEAMPEILEEYPDARIKISGANIVETENFMQWLKLSSYGKYLRALIETYRLKDKIEFLGKLNAREMKLQYIRSHVFACPSAIENSPNSVGEAMLLGVPVVAARVGGIPSILHEPEEGILFEKGNSQGLAEAIRKVWGNDILAEEMSVNEHRRALENYNREDNFRMLLNIYKRISGLKVVE